jgi:MtfA peptidase
LPIIVLLVLAVLGAALWAAWRHRRRRLREALLVRQPPALHLAILERNLPLYRRLPPELRRRLGGLVNVFLDDKEFVGCDGLAVTDEMRVTVAGNACLLLLGGDRAIFPGFRTILVYPDSFVADQTSYDGLVEIRERSVRSGESWERGPVVLAWADIEEDMHCPGDGRNVVLHEFAHKLDEENDSMDGLPILSDRSQLAQWRDVLSREYDALRRDAEAGRESILDPYGAESPAEFFAVATEAFFGMPGTVRDQLPDLYDQLQRYYNLDPAGWRHSTTDNEGRD